MMEQKDKIIWVLDNMEKYLMTSVIAGLCISSEENKLLCKPSLVWFSVT
jgi:hypothetical protein